MRRHWPADTSAKYSIFEARHLNNPSGSGFLTEEELQGDMATKEQGPTPLSNGTEDVSCHWDKADTTYGLLDAILIRIAEDPDKQATEEATSRIPSGEIPAAH